MNKQHIPIIVVFIVAVTALGIYTISSRNNVSPHDGAPGIDDSAPPPQTGRVADPSVPAPVSGKLKAATFTGTLEEVNTGCFADGECFVTVDGKHVTALMGWSRDTVGSVQGVESFGDLESYIGKTVEVYAQDLSDGTYTLYGSEGFYIRVMDAGIGDGQSMSPGSGIPQKIPPPIVQDGCVVGGCSSQLCVDASEGDIVNTCEWREEYACYRNATCERQASGQCGWTMTDDLNACLANSGVSAL